jgi:hypothetical protein
MEKGEDVELVLNPAFRADLAGRNVGSDCQATILRVEKQGPECGGLPRSTSLDILSEKAVGGKGICVRIGGSCPKFAQWPRPES